MSDMTVTHALTRALVSLVADHVPHDIQALLVHGDPMRSIPPGALARACLAFAEEGEQP